MKPIGFYCNMQEGSLLAQMESELGSNFQALTKIQKLALLNFLVVGAANAEVAVIGSYQAYEEEQAIAQWMERIKKELPIGEHLVLAQFLLDVVKEV